MANIAIQNRDQNGYWLLRGESRVITVGENFILQRMMLFGVTIWFVVVLGCSG